MNKYVTNEDIEKAFQDISRRNFIYGLIVGLTNAIWIGILLSRIV